MYVLLLLAALPALALGLALGDVKARALGQLSVGFDNVPLGAAFLFGHESPDLFVANTPESGKPGIFLYEFVPTDDATNGPVFKRRHRVQHPFPGLLPRGAATIIQIGDAVHGLWHTDGDVVTHSKYEPAAQGFVGRREIKVAGLPPGATVLSIAYLPDGSTKGDLVMEVSSHAAPQLSTEQVVANGGYADPFYNPHDSAADQCPRSASGVWNVDITADLFVAQITLDASTVARAKKQRRPEPDMHLGHVSMAPLLFNATGSLERGLVAGSVTGMLYMLVSTRHGDFKARTHLKTGGGDVLAHKYPRARPIVYADRSGAPHLVVGGVGPLQFLRFNELSLETGWMPTYMPGTDVLETDASLYVGSQPVLSAADWDGDGRTDLISGTADGRILLLQNVGNDTHPAFMRPIALRADGEEIRLRGGHFALEGPAESSFGYANPAPFDWNGDGQLDLVCVGPLGLVQVFLNTGTRGAPRLAAARQLFVDGFELRGAWQVKPAVARYQGRTLLVLLDDANEFHAYTATGGAHLRDAGKLLLQTARGAQAVRAHTLHGGATGRVTVELVDFDGDGTLDLLVGAPRHASIPGPEGGLPQSQGYAGSVALLLQGHVAEQGTLPRFQRPSVLLHNGSAILTGRYQGSVASSPLGRHGPHLLVGDESGRVAMYDRSLLSTATLARFAATNAQTQAEALEPLSLQAAAVTNKRLVQAMQQDGPERHLSNTSSERAPLSSRAPSQCDSPALHDAATFGALSSIGSGRRGLTVAHGGVDAYSFCYGVLACLVAVGCVRHLLTSRVRLMLFEKGRDEKNYV